MPLAQDIEQQVRHDFPAAEVVPVSDMLRDLQQAESQLFTDRILRCLVWVARGRFAALADAVTLARTDYRDLIVAAEYNANWQQVRDFTHPFPA